MTSYNRDVHDAAQTGESPEGCWKDDRVPRHGDGRGQQQDRAEVDDGRRGKGGARFPGKHFRVVGNERQDNELEPDEGARGPADDQAKSAPFGEFGY